MIPGTHEGPHTWEDFVNLDEEDRRELIDGELVEVEVPSKIHEHIVLLLGFFLTGWARQHKAGYALASGFKVRIAAKRGVMPDLQFFRPGNPARGQERALERGHPDLAVEIISPSSPRYDRVIKLAWYASIGVPEYWIVDPKQETLERLVLRDGAYSIADALCADEIFRPDTFEGLEIPLAELWTLPE